MRTFRFLAILSFLLFLTGVSEVEACRCFGRPQGVKGIQTCSYYWNSEEVFIGLAEKVEIDERTGGMKVTFSVERPIRGASEKTVEIFTSASTASCGYPFKQGKRYFVYGRKGQDGKLSESLCGPTTLLEDAEDDLEYAKEIEEGKPGTRISGKVFDQRQTTVKDEAKSVPLSGVQVTISNGRDVFTALTDEDGAYLFKDFPKDTYRVTANLPPGYRELFHGIEPKEHFAGGCGGAIFRVTRQGSIRGKVVDFPSTEIKNPWNRDQVQQPKVSLIALDENDQIIPHRSYEEKWAYRDKFEYYFDFVPAGRYLLAMNPYNCPYPNNGVPPTYFPGVADRSKAKIITVKDGEHLVLENFRSLPLLMARTFMGVVLNADKTPAANAVVRLLDQGSPCNSVSAETKTDEAGRFQLKGFEGYGYRIQAHMPGPDGRTRAHAKLFPVPQEGRADDIQLFLERSF